MAIEIKRPGALHKALGIPQGQKIPLKAERKALKSGSPSLRKQANFAINARQWNRGKSGNR